MNHGGRKTGICILGAGPAGIAAAMRLSRRGIPFTLLEKEMFPRSKVCGDGLSGKSLVMLKNLDENLVRSLHDSGLGQPSWGVKFISPNLRSVTLGFHDKQPEIPAGYVVQRADLDHFLMRELKKVSTGEIIQGVPVSQVSRTGEGFRLASTVKGFGLECRLLLVATGYVPGLVRTIDPAYPSSVNDGLGIRTYFEGVEGIDDLHPIEIHFLKELLPCYLWIFPLGQGRANVGLAMLSSLAKKNKVVQKNMLFQILEGYPYLKKRFRHARSDGKVEAHRLPFHQGTIPVSGDHYMLLGDAARIVDPFTGEGISNALLSGMIAADLACGALKSQDFSSGYLQEYDRQLYSRTGKELSLGMRLQDLAKNAMLLNLVIGRASRSPKIRDALRETLFGMNAMGELEKPMFYVKLMLGIG